MGGIKMSEHLKGHHKSGGESLELHEAVQENLKRMEAAAKEAAAEGVPENSLEQLQEQADNQAISGQEYTIGEREVAPATHTFGAHKQLKADSYKRTLSHLRAKLNPTEKLLSKHIHSKKAEKIDSVAATTIARPWGLFAGGLCAFVGSLVVLIFANHLGFRYNFTVFLALFFGGYLAGTILEAAGKIISKKRS